MLTSPPSYAGQSEIANLKTPFNASFQLLLKTNVGPGIEELQSLGFCFCVSTSSRSGAGRPQTDSQQVAGLPNSLDF
ncbi:mCG21292, isoform CRA_d [Mus musculus]|nr:mCG21292, isoform CRA_d [Mus musculus]